MLTPYSDQVIFTLMNSKDSYVNFTFDELCLVIY